MGIFLDKHLMRKNCRIVLTSADTSRCSTMTISFEVPKSLNLCRLGAPCAQVPRLPKRPRTHGAEIYGQQFIMPVSRELQRQTVLEGKSWTV